MDSKYISLQVTGNPIANAGYQAIAWYNNPDIEIKKNDYVGFGSNPYFFVVKIKPKTIIFTIIVNRVRSYEASRQGVSLKIAFSVPKNYKFEGNISPYTVLVHLKDYFIAKCMTLQADGYYMYKEGIVPNTILDDIAKKYPLAEAKGPYHIMRDGQPIGYVVTRETDIAQLLNDVQYSIFSNYSEVVIAEKVDATTYMPIVNIQIPRPKEYTIFVNNNKERVVTNVNEKITYFGDGNPKYYENKSLSFSIKELLETKSIPNVTLDEENEIVYIDTRSLKEAKKVLVKIHLIPNDGSLVWVDQSDITIRHNRKKIELNPNLEFELVGEEISYLGNIDSFSVDFNNKKYKIDRFERDGYDINVHIRESETQVIVREDPNKRHKNYPVKEISIILKGSNEIFKERESLLIELGLSSNGDFILFQRTRVHFRKDRSGYKGIMYISNELMNDRPFLRFSVLGCRFTTGHLPLEKEKIELKDSDFQVKPISFIKRHKSLLIFLFCVIFGLVLGLPLGYCAHNIVNNVFNKEKCVRCPECNQDFKTEEEMKIHKMKDHKNKCKECGQTFENQDYLDSHIKEVHPSSPDTPICEDNVVRDATKNPPKHKCDKCSMEFDTKEELDKHKNDEHTATQNPYKCNKCSQSFASGNELTTHKYNVHMLKCNGDCGKVRYFETQKELDSHIKSNHEI